MKELLKTYGDFFRSLDWKLVLAASIMTLLVIIGISLIYMVFRAIKFRREALKVTLPDIYSIDNESNRIKPQFKENEDLSIELVDSEQDKKSINKEVKPNNGFFDKTLTMETREYIADETIIADMPEIEEFDLEEFKKQRFESAARKSEEQAEKLRQIAKSDEEGSDYELKELLSSNIGGDENLWLESLYM